jgi:hypothetical protein
MKRIVYSPKVNAFVKTDTGVLDLSPFLVRGSVTRKLDQVSSANLEFRNPNEIFTPESGPLIHPMDPIVIFMSRLKDKPVQIFTGYVDSAPYFSIKAGGDLTLDASCTLKRLLYTYYDPGLRFFHDFLRAQGWALQGGDSVLPPGSGETVEEDQQDNDNNDQYPEPLSDGLNDASFGRMLYETLVYIGNWDPSSIYIENLPDGIIDLVEGIFYQIDESSKGDRDAIRKVLEYILENNTFYGTGDPGNGSTDLSTYGGEGPPPFAEVTPVDVGRAMLNAGFPRNEETLAAGIYVVDVESKFGTYSGWRELNSAGCVGYWQFQIEADWGGHDISLKDACTLVPATMFAKTLWTGGVGTAGFDQHWYSWWSGAAVGTQNASQYLPQAREALRLGKFQQ